MSLRAEIVRLGVRWFIKRRSHLDTTIEQRRQFAAKAERLVPAPPAQTETCAVDAAGVNACRIAVPASETDRHVLFLHGGGFIIGSPSLYRHLTWRIAAAARAR